MVTYSDDYDALDIHGWNYYLIDDIFFIIYALSMVSGMAMICIDYSPMFLCRNMQIECEQAPLVDSFGQPIYG